MSKPRWKTILESPECFIGTITAPSSSVLGFWCDGRDEKSKMAADFYFASTVGERWMPTWDVYVLGVYCTNTQGTDTRIQIRFGDRIEQHVSLTIASLLRGDLDCSNTLAALLEGTIAPSDLGKMQDATARLVAELIIATCEIRAVPRKQTS